MHAFYVFLDLPRMVWVGMVGLCVFWFWILWFDILFFYLIWCFFKFVLSVRLCPVSSHNILLCFLREAMLCLTYFDCVVGEDCLGWFYCTHILESLLLFWVFRIGFCFHFVWLVCCSLLSLFAVHLFFLFGLLFCSSHC